MKNKIKDNEYSNQIKKAQEFLNEHDGDNKLIILFSDLKNSKKLHSMKWSDIYEFITIHYPNDLDIVTGLCYLTEENEET